MQEVKNSRNWVQDIWEPSVLVSLYFSVSLKLLYKTKCI